MGPMKSLSGILDEVRRQTDEVQSFVRRMRDANRHLTGSTGEQPTKLVDRIEGGSAGRMVEPDRNPLMVDMTTAIESLNAANSDLRAEIVYFEQMVSETSQEASAPPVAYSR